VVRDVDGLEMMQPPNSSTACRGAPESRPFGVVLLDDAVVVREAISLLIGRDDRARVIAQAPSLRESPSADSGVDVVVTELVLPDARSHALIAALRDRYPQAGILVLTRLRHASRVQQAIAAGAHGYLLKTVSPAELLDGLCSVARGETYLQASLGIELARWHGTDRDAGSPGRVGLSAKEEEVLRLIALGHVNAEVARLANMSLRTVESHRARISQKFGFGTRAELVHYALASGILELGEL
jgi:two-component system response regulator NreC